jgi:uncharacterized protein (TIGR03435 family)
MRQCCPGRLAAAGEIQLAAALAAAIVLLLAGVVNGPHLRAQPQAALGTPAGPTFEVASVRPAPDLQTGPKAGPAPRIGINVDRARVDIGHWSIEQLIARAYGLQPYQLAGPAWMNRFRFDIAAKLPEGATQEQIPGMLRWLLVERFGLVAHSETRQLPGFALVVAKGGPKMKPAAPEVSSSTDSKSPGARDADPYTTSDVLWGSDASAFGLKAFAVAGGEVHMEFAKMPMEALTQIVASYLRAPVTDMTALKGRYQMTLDFSLANSSASAREPGAPGGGAPAVAPDSFNTSLFSAVQGLGLRLEARRVPFPVLVVDRLEQAPTEN